MRADSSGLAGLRPALWGLWILLTVAAVGFALLAAGLFIGKSVPQQIGIATLSFGALSYLFLQFWVTTTNAQVHLLAAPRPTPAAVLASSRSSNGIHAAPLVTPRRTPPRMAAPPPQEDLVLFEAVPSILADAEPVPAAKANQVLNNVVTLDPAPMEHWPADPAEAPRPAVEDFHAMTLQRRNEFIRDLPLVEQILSEPAAGAAPAKPTRTLGQCGNCGTKLWAPSTRPIRIRCPRCGRAALLN